MTELFSEQDLMDAMNAAGIDLTDSKTVEVFLNNFRKGLTESLNRASVENTEQDRKAKLMAEAAAVGADMNPAHLLEIAFSKPHQETAKQIPDDISGISNPAELLKIGFEKQKRGK